MASSRLQSSFEEWEKAAGAGATGDPLWSIQAYRRAEYAVDTHTRDRQSNSQLATAPAFDQLTRALGSISANIAEGYSRSSAADRARFYSYALGSTREALAWYNTLRIELGPLVDERQALLIQIRRLLLTTLRNMRVSDPTGMLTDFRRKK
ncbi:MAG TPA: four helix bundle protein [Gemmatimonadaceae bacterium]|jgi:four helix bundle protein